MMRDRQDLTLHVVPPGEVGSALRQPSIRLALSSHVLKSPTMSRDPAVVARDFGQHFVQLL
jgi:hypothetical protein